MSATIRCPRILYGTAWKGDATACLVAKAVRAGFRGIDTAAQPKHYNEKLVGEGLADGAREAGLTREQIFLQTKFSPVDAQDVSKPMPYDIKAPLAEQVAQSIASSLRNLQTTYLDSLVLHSPLRRMNDTISVWRAFEKSVDDKVVLQLGLSNCYDLETFKQLYEAARIKPRVLQNRFYAASGFDVELRKFCQEMNVTYQSFWTLSANDEAMGSTEFTEVARGFQLTAAQTMYAFVRSLGIVPLSGTKNVDHMKEDLQVIEKCGQDGNGLLDPSSQRVLASLVGVPSV